MSEEVYPTFSIRSVNEDPSLLVSENDPSSAVCVVVKGTVPAKRRHVAPAKAVESDSENTLP